MKTFKLIFILFMFVLFVLSCGGEKSKEKQTKNERYSSEYGDYGQNTEYNKTGQKNSNYQTNNTNNGYNQYGNSNTYSQNNYNQYSRSNQYSNNQSNSLMQHFVGTWKNFSSSNQVLAVLYPDGTFKIRNTSAYSNYDQGWGGAADNFSQGRWSIRGNAQAGTLIINYTNGSQDYINYRVHVENGQAYWREYYFDGDLYQKQ